MNSFCKQSILMVALLASTKFAFPYNFLFLNLSSEFSESSFLKFLTDVSQFYVGADLHFFLFFLLSQVNNCLLFRMCLGDFSNFLSGSSNFWVFSVATIAHVCRSNYFHADGVCSSFCILASFKRCRFGIDRYFFHKWKLWASLGFFPAWGRRTQAIIQVTLSFFQKWKKERQSDRPMFLLSF